MPISFFGASARVIARTDLALSSLITASFLEKYLQAQRNNKTFRRGSDFAFDMRPPV
jgi:hypothetical protein